MSEADSRIIYLEMETKPSVLGNRFCDKAGCITELITVAKRGTSNCYKIINWNLVQDEPKKFT